MSEIVQNKIKRFEELKNARTSGGWDPHWKELQKFFLPRRGRWLEDSGQRGGKKHQELIDPTPKMAARTLASGMMAGSTNPAQPWFRLVTPDIELMEIPAVSQWLYTVENKIRDIFEKSNLYRILPTTYLESGVFGTSPIIISEDDEHVISCLGNTIGSYYLAQDHNGKVDTLYRVDRKSTRQMVMQFGFENCSPQIQAIYKDQHKEQQHDVLYLIEPRSDRDIDSPLAKDMPFRAMYIDLAWMDRPLKESGFTDNPIAIFRWETTAEDVYGSSPGMDALGCAKAMQVQQKRKAQAIDKHIDPPMVADPSLQNQPSTLLPGGVTYAGFTPSGSAPRFAPAYVVKPELAGIMEDIRDIRDLTNECMYVTLFQMFSSSDRRQITAEEIMRKNEEKLLLIGPALGNHKHELIEPTVDRTFNIMVRRSEKVWNGTMDEPQNANWYIPPPPEELDGASLKVEMISPLAQAQKMASVGSIERFVNFVGMLGKVQADAGVPPTVFDKVDLDQTVDEYAIAVGVPPTLPRSDEDVAQMREDRTQQQQAAQAAAMAQPAAQAAGAAKDLSETQVGGASALDRITGVAA